MKRIAKDIIIYNKIRVGKYGPLRKAFEVIKSVLVWVVIILAILLMLFTVFSVTALEKEERSLFGYRAFVVLSDSMSKIYPNDRGYFNAGDVVVSKKVDPDTLDAVDIISFISYKDGASVVVTHMIRERTVTETGEDVFITYGTTTGVDDEIPVSYDKILGEYKFRLIGLGKFFYFLKSPLGYTLLIFVPFLCMLIVNGLRVAILFKEYRDSEAARIKNERDELEAERKLSEDLKKEIEELRAQLLGDTDNKQ